MEVVHLDGLNLSRASGFWRLGQDVGSRDSRSLIIYDAAANHARAGLSGISSGDYMGEHWLGSFARYMLDCVPEGWKDC